MGKRGGNRKHPIDCTCGHCPIIGRPKKRLIDQDVAGRILAKVQAENLWVEIIDKARHARNTLELQSALRYLEDRHLGRPTEHKQIDGNLTYEPSSATERLERLLAEGVRKAPKLSESERPN